MEYDDLLIDESDLPPLLLTGEEPEDDAPLPAEDDPVPDEFPGEDAPDFERDPDDDDTSEAEEDLDSDDASEAEEDSDSDGDTDDDGDSDDDRDSDDDAPDDGEQPAKKHLAVKILLCVLAVLLIAGAGTGAYFYLRNPAKDLVIPVTAVPMEQPPVEEPAIDVDLRGTVLTPEELAQTREETGIEKVYCSVSVCGIEADSMAEELDLSGSTAIDLDEIREALSVLTRVQKVILPLNCGYTNEELSAFNDEMGDVRVVWTMAVGRFSTIRTDATYFCKNASGMMVPMTNEEAQVLQYCPDIIALDLGHCSVTDIGFLRNMPNLRYLVLADTDINDISVLSELKGLYYIELFMDNIDDLSPLLDLTELRYLNIGWVKTNDVSPLFEMNWLDYLWYPCSSMTQQQMAELREACPDTQMYLVYYDVSGSTGGGWHYTEGYYEQRDALHMPYLT